MPSTCTAASAPCLVGSWLAQLGRQAVAVELRVDEDAVSFLERAEKELARAAQNETRVSGKGSA